MSLSPLRRRAPLAAFLLVASLFSCAAGCNGCGDEASAADAGPRRRDAGPRRRDAGPRDAGPRDLGPTAPADDDGIHLGHDRGRFFDRVDGDVRQRLATGVLATVERGYGGRSVAFKITLADGTKGYFKPEQTFSAAHWYAEIAAYHLDRELGLGRVAPVVGRRFEWETLRRSAPGDDRFSEVIVAADGTVRGAFVWWIPERLPSLRIGAGWERWVRVQGWPEGAITPFQRARAYTEAAARRRAEREGVAPTSDEQEIAPAPTATAEPEGAPPAEGEVRVDELPPARDPDTAERPGELSDLVVFDYLTLNLDRWGGGNANVLTRGAGGPIVFLDNAAGFSPGIRRSGLMDARLHVVQRFRRRTIDAVRALDVRHWQRRMATDPLAPVLTDEMMLGFEARRAHLLEHVAQMEARFGAAEVYPW